MIKKTKEFEPRSNFYVGVICNTTPFGIKNEETISDKKTTERDILVRELGTFPIPPKVMDHGKLINPEVLSRENLLLINQVNPHLQQLIITLTDVCGVKRVERIPALVLVQGDRETEIESRLSRSPLLSGKSFYTSYHMPLSALREGDKNPPVFFTGIRKIYRKR